MELIAFIIVGWVTGLICSVIVPRPRDMGLVSMALVGMVGSIFGAGMVGTFSSRQPLFAIGAPSLLGASLGALVVVLVMATLSRQRAHV
jgi:uncharacterized membrane protein YeaQ/YmgE (transglycosylase-associated protein family)